VIVVMAALGALLLSGCLTPGQHGVGPTLGNGQATPGLWHSGGSNNSPYPSLCTWTRYGLFGLVEASDITRGGPMYAEVKDTDTSFSTGGCQVWVQADGALDTKYPATSQGQFGDGQYRIGVEVPPGVYSSNQPDHCSWEVVSRFDGEGSSVVEHGLGGAVTIPTGYLGFSSQGCGIWTKVG
jgi:hypothetical protein